MTRKKKAHSGPHADMLKLKFHMYLTTMQSVKTGLYRTFFYRVRQQGSFEVLQVFCLHFALWKLEIPNFDPLYSKLGELNIQNSLPWVTHNMPGTCWLIFIGFYHIDFWAEYEGSGLSYPLVRPFLIPH